MLANRFKLDPERIVVDLSQITELREVDLQVVLLGAHFMKQYSLSTFDAFHGAFCFSHGDKILSSDKASERAGLQRVPLERASAA